MIEMIDKEKLEFLYCQDKISVPDIAKEFICSKDTIYRRLMKFNIQRNRGISIKPKGFREKISRANKGRPCTWGTKISKTRKERKIKQWNDGKHFNHSLDCQCPFCVGVKGERNPSKRPEIRSKISEVLKYRFKLGIMRSYALDKNPAWRGGISFEPYSPDFNSVLKKSIKERDNFSCQKCGMTEKQSLEKYDNPLAIHHKDFNKKNSSPDNLETLCHKCHGGTIKMEYFGGGV